MSFTQNNKKKTNNNGNLPNKSAFSFTNSTLFTQPIDQQYEGGLNINFNNNSNLNEEDFKNLEILNYSTDSCTEFENELCYKLEKAKISNLNTGDHSPASKSGFETTSSSFFSIHDALKDSISSKIKSKNRQKNINNNINSNLLTVGNNNNKIKIMNFLSNNWEVKRNCLKYKLFKKMQIVLGGCKYKLSHHLEHHFIRPISNLYDILE
jgi:hypothetical protein